MENGAISAIYSHDEALKLSEKQLAAMGLRPFDTPAFQVLSLIHIFLCQHIAVGRSILYDLPNRPYLSGSVLKQYGRDVSKRQVYPYRSHLRINF